MRRASLLLLLALPLAAQEFKFDLSHLDGRATDTLDLSLTHSTLQFAAKFIDGKDPEEARVKKLIEGIDGIVIKTFEFKNASSFVPADLDKLRGQLRAPEWSRMLGFKSAQEGETSEIYVREVNKKVMGIAIISAEPKQLTVVAINGNVDLDSLADLSGHFGVPKLERKRKN